MTEPVFDVYGHIARNVVYDFHVKCEIQIICPVSTQVPYLGTTLEASFSDAGTIKGYCTQCVILETNQSFRKMAVVIEATRYCDAVSSESAITNYMGDKVPDKATGFDWLGG